MTLRWGCEPRVASHGLRAEGCELVLLSFLFEPRVASHGLRAKIQYASLSFLFAGGRSEACLFFLQAKGCELVLLLA